MRFVGGTGAREGRGERGKCVCVCMGGGGGKNEG